MKKIKLLPTKKRRETPKSARDMIAPQNCRFITLDGTSFATLKQLIKALDTMNDDVFHYHVTESKNDFSNWVRDVFQDMKLAERLMQAKTSKDMQIILLKYMLNM